MVTPLRCNLVRVRQGLVMSHYEIQDVQKALKHLLLYVFHNFNEISAR